ncbi:Two-component response regulator [Clostridium pasteurianum DSM 525 = ATCC 6013]|uniref:Stage 0 sporulation protein A homolog n=1 Tax=Clostridium pasteurianum DSM 525 = ATCC 6013 TaxID=1262449 RepID=A0A0H3J8Q4_CLOPA|nr:response regulator [Clostridium pasteurianum]AJA48343.1 Two-component response regulator [Clostridium pasteurianum DSM 525 = ATCC 6013]AJA52331.1 Two-component response regulator [Clostridium pasteurianum DSM 525 = ATCC 6013]ELP60507.1 two-component response regulator [Clostridium pasteurianum DSM 525 = ATCC 6013]KRU11659.1 two component transcriptional regulator, AraC family [Clostridium pasteurianum DSM 525 = ATCC 6013]OMH22228.1 hypothetical protein AC231_00425 [Clostridium pasteurianum]
MYKILLVDDENLEREALKIMLKNIKDEIEVVGEAENGREAIELDEKLDPDIIFMDIKIPGIDGMKASEIIKNKNQNKVIIMLTAYDDFNLIHKALTLNVNDYILKPLKYNQLLEILNTQIINLKFNKNKIKEMEFQLIDKIVYYEKKQAIDLMNNIINSYIHISNNDAVLFKERLQLLMERIIKAACTFNFKDNDSISEEYSNKLKYSSDIESASKTIEKFLILILEKTIEEDSIKINNKSEKGKVYINKTLEPAIKYIQENYREEIGLEKMACITNLSVYYFSRLFKREMGVNFINYVNNFKMQKAKKMLKDTDLPIVDIAADLGYYECGYFTKVFKKIIGITPSKYRNYDKEDY